MLRRACEQLTALERRDRLLSTCASRGQLGHILPALLHGLRQEGGCSLALDSGHTMRLELPPPPRPPPQKVGQISARSRLDLG